MFDLARLLDHGDERVRAAVAAHPRLPLELAWLLVDDPSDTVRHQLALRHFPGIANVLADDPSALVQLAIYDDPNLDPDLKARLFKRSRAAVGQMSSSVATKTDERAQRCE